MSRSRTITQKVSTRYGSHYVHVSLDGRRIVEVAFSSPGKFSDTALADLLFALSAGVNNLIADVAKDGP